jgi:hypothetical protein
MDAPGPATGALLPFVQFLHRPLDPARARFRLLGIIDPADELVAPERGQAFSERQSFGIGHQRRLHVIARSVDGSVGKGLGHGVIQYVGRRDGSNRRGGLPFWSYFPTSPG